MLSCYNAAVRRHFSSYLWFKRKKKRRIQSPGLLSSISPWGFLIQADMHPTREKQGSKSNSSFSLKTNATLNIQQYCAWNRTWKGESWVSRRWSNDWLAAFLRQQLFSPSLWEWKKKLFCWFNYFTVDPVKEVFTVLRQRHRVLAIRMAAPSCSSLQLCPTDVRKMSNLGRCLMLR